ncbi:MAG: hypothetical protein ACOX81_04005 [Candidatus Heteroscillospira sp.]
MRLSLPGRERLSHAYILISPARYKRELAMRLAAHMLCRSGREAPCGVCPDCRKIAEGIHPDVTAVERPLDDKGKQKREVLVNQIRALSMDSVVLPNEAEFKVYALLDAEFMNTQAQNALLKLLEEPPERVRFILCAENPGALLDTIRSRCVELTARCGGGDIPCEEHARRYLELAAAGNRLELLRFCLDMEENTPAELEDFLQGARLITGSALARRESGIELSPRALTEIYDLLTRCRTYLLANVGVKQVLGLLAAATF